MFSEATRSTAPGRDGRTSTRPTLVRFESARPDAAGHHVGVFGLINVLGRRNMLSAEEETFRRAANAWYDAAYPDPCAVDPTVYDAAVNPGAAAWFKESAGWLLERVPPYLAVLDAHGVAWRRRCLTDPGRVVYEDHVQVVAVEEAVTGGHGVGVALRRR